MPIRPWIGYKSWTTDSVGLIHVGNTPYYDELIWHLALNGADSFLYFAPTLVSGYGMATDTDHIYLDNLLKEIQTRGVTTTGTSVTLDDIPWNSDVVASGMKINSSTVLWRITAPPGQGTVNVIKNGALAEHYRFLQGSAGVWYTTTPGELVSFYLPSTRYQNRPPTAILWAPATSSPGGNAQAQSRMRLPPIRTAPYNSSDSFIRVSGRGISRCRVRISYIIRFHPRGYTR